MEQPGNNAEKRTVPHAPQEERFSSGESAAVPARTSLSSLSTEVHVAPAEGFSLQEKEALLGVARRSLEHAISAGCACELAPAKLLGRLAQKRGCFVTLTKAGELRGCIGQLAAERPLYATVAENTAGAALRDVRFGPVERSELPEIRIEISVLTEPEPVLFTSPDDLLAQLQPHQHGVVLRIGSLLSTFLPKVWEHIPDKIEFMDRLAQKAGCGASTWRSPDAQVLLYRAESFAEPIAGDAYA